MTMGNCSSEATIRISPAGHLPSSASQKSPAGISNAELAWTAENSDAKYSETNVETKTQEAAVLQGYLRTREGVFRMQIRRWYFLHEGQIRVKRNQRSTRSSTIPLCDLRLCQVALLPDRRSFSITPPVPPGMVFHAASERDAQRWQDMLTEYISNGLAQRGLQKVPDTVIDLIRANPACADCNAANPEWISLNLGIVICTQCAAIHRTLGPQISQVRSLVNDRNCLSASSFALLNQLGNGCVNEVWEGWINEIRSNNYSGRHDREHWIRSKYVYRFFIKHEFLLHAKDPGLRLYEAASAGSLIDMVRSLAAGASTKWIDEEGNNALHVATVLGSIPCVQFLLYNGSDIWSTNNNGQTAADVAEVGSELHQLLKHQQSLVAPRSLLPVADPDAKNRAFASVAAVPPRQFRLDDDQENREHEQVDHPELFEDSMASDEMRALDEPIDSAPAAASTEQTSPDAEQHL